MAFPIPSHLPRKKDARDVSTQILTKVSETSSKDLSAKVASTWVSELDETIKLTKKRIHDRISDDLPDFQRQFDTAVSVQERLRSLSQNVDVLNERISGPQSGLVPNLLTNLRSHSALAQETADARARHGALAHLLRCRDELRQLTQLVEEGELPQATQAHASLQNTLRDAPEALQRSEIMADVKRRCVALGNRTAEQLLQAYSRSVVVSASEVVVRHSVQVPQSTSTFSLSSIIGSMAPSALATHISTLRRDILAHCVEYVLKQPVTISEEISNDLSGPVQHRLRLYPAPPGESDLTIRLDRLTTIVTFLHQHLLPHFPAAERKSLALSLSTPLRTAVLNHLLLPHLPSSLPKLPNYLILAKRAVQAEDDIVVKMLGDTSGERSVKSWVDSVGLHYERKRRAEILDCARVIVTGPDDSAKSFRAEVTLALEEAFPSAPAEKQEPATNGAAHETQANGKKGHDIEGLDEAESAWDFEEETAIQSEESSGDGWGFDDEVEPEVPPEPQVEHPSNGLGIDKAQGTEEVTEEDADDAWGWNDDTTATTAEDEVVEDSPWDDPWEEKPSEPEPISSPTAAPKPAKGLQKFSKSTPSSPAVPPPISPSRSRTQDPPHPPARSIPQQPPVSVPSKPVKVTESYLVSGRTKDVLQLLEDVLREGTELVASGVLQANVSGSPGNVIMQAAPMALELFRALVPVVNAALLQQSSKEAMRFANDCRFVAQELERVVSRLTGAKAVVRDKLEEALESLQVLAESWFEDAIAREERLIEELLDGARGFIDTTHQERYDECEDAVNEALQRIRRVAPQWKAVLAKSKYYEALGALVETAVSRVLGDILALEDITEVESHRLSELCRILHALEGLFIEDPDQPSFIVSYVPSWLKFSYLSELLEASIADISYLFEEGALVDFEIDELVKLVRALFADTPLRANTINRLLQGHPVSGS
ncbi:hypothetical protein PYCCODRAFT_1433123 [Trametes coccinea BRFM310]|uniref:ZW10 C-terminal helical domain-containing protein n=1 Tax=Trametes coccinea (strain BRFM310) TaxID=1353009 RepID=A0A1Y2IUM2_TRAC3|nr:hypothetical protein PYCCODRAFT_1433123 [Trametes coccinea BRFM310]